MAKHFVLIHGAWHGGWCWEGVIQALQQAGHTAEAPTLPGHGPDDESSGIEFDTYVSMIVRVLERQTAPVVLVGHANAGCLLQAAAPQVPEKIERLIFLNAFVLPDGKCQFDLVPLQVARAMRAIARARLDNCVPVLKGYVHDVLMAGERVELRDALMQRLVRQPVALFTTKVRTQTFSTLDIPKTVVFCKDDTSLPPGTYLGMAQHLGEHDLIEVGGGHEALFTRPDIVSQGLLQAISSNGRCHSPGRGRHLAALYGVGHNFSHA